MPAVEWLDPTEMHCRLFPFYFYFFFFRVILIDFELDCPILRAFIEWERRAGVVDFNAVHCYSMCDVHLLHHLRSRYWGGVNLWVHIPFFLLLFFYYIIVAIIFIFLTLTRTGSEPMGCWTLCMGTTPWSVWRSYFQLRYNKMYPPILIL